MGKHQKCHKCHKSKKAKYNVKVKCKPEHEDTEAENGEWNLAIVPQRETSTFRPTPNENTSGKFTSVSNIIHNHADFRSLGLGATTEGDFFNTVFTLEKDAALNSVDGYAIHWTEVSGTQGNYIKFIQTDLSYDDRVTARVHNVNITEAGNVAPPASAEYEGFTFITQEAL